MKKIALVQLSTRFYMEDPVGMPSLQFKKRVSSSAIDKCIVTLAMLVSHRCQVWVAFCTVFTNYQGVIVGVCCQEMLGVVTFLNDDFTQSIIGKVSWTLRYTVRCTFTCAP